MEVNLGVRVTSLETRDLQSSRLGLTVVLWVHRSLLRIDGYRLSERVEGNTFGLGADEQGAEWS